MQQHEPESMSIPAFPEQTSNWTPLIALIGEERAQAFMLVGNCGEIMIYKHAITRGFLNIHIASGQTYQSGGDHAYVPVDPEVAVGSVLGPCAIKRAKRTVQSL